MLDWIIAALAGTYLHKKFPKQTEVVAKGIFKTTEFAARKAYDSISKAEGRIIEERVSIDRSDTGQRRQFANSDNDLAKGRESWRNRTR